MTWAVGSTNIVIEGDKSWRWRW